MLFDFQLFALITLTSLAKSFFNKYSTADRPDRPDRPAVHNTMLLSIAALTPRRVIC